MWEKYCRVACVLPHLRTTFVSVHDVGMITFDQHSLGRYFFRQIPRLVLDASSHTRTHAPPDVEKYVRFHHVIL